MVRRHSGGRVCFRIRILYGCNARTTGAQVAPGLLALEPMLQCHDQ